jgi:hypothetical protein
MIMKKALFSFILIIGFFSTSAQKSKSLPFIIMVDNDLPDASVILSSNFLITDSLNNKIDSLNCKYQIGRLTMSTTDYKSFINVRRNKAKWRIYFVFTYRHMHVGVNTTDYNYKCEFFSFTINDEYMILKIFNSFDKESLEKLVFKDGKSYVYQMVTPGFNTLLPYKRAKP